MSSVLLAKTAVTDGEVAPQVLCDEGPRLADSASRTLASPVALAPVRLVLLLGVRQLFLEEIYNHSTFGASSFAHTIPLGFLGSHPIYT